MLSKYEQEEFKHVINNEAKIIKIRIRLKLK